MKNPVVGLFEVGEKVLCKPTTNPEPKELTYIIRKGRNTAWLHDNNGTNLVCDWQISSLLSSEVVKVGPENNIGHDAIQDPVTSKTSKTNALSPVLSQKHTAAANDRPKRLRTQTQRF